MNIRTSAFRGLAILSLTALGMAACEDKDVINIPEPDPPAVEVTVVPTQATIPVGGTAAAAAVVKNATNTAVTWACAPAGVVTISAAGVITGVAPGSAVCTATSAQDANAKGAVSVTVTAPVVTMTVLPTTAQINSAAPGNTVQLTATVSGTANQAVTWATNAAGVATVSAAGLVTAVAPGTAVITATSAADANVKVSAVVTVVPPVVTPVVIAVQPTSASTTIGGTIQLVPNVTGTTNTAVTYRSSTPAVATVNGAGMVTGVSGGTSVITVIAAADTTKKATSVITVAGAPPAASISIASVVDHETGAPVDPDDISGQIDVTVNISAVPENGVRAVVVYIAKDTIAPDADDQVCRQNFSTPLGTTQGVATINCPVNTARYGADFVPDFLNGDWTIYTRALDLNESSVTLAQFCPIPGEPCVVTFDNDDFVVYDVTFEQDDEDADGTTDPNVALDANGLRWNGGNVVALVHPVMYSGRTLSRVMGSLTCDDSDFDSYDEDVEFDAAGTGWTYTWDEDDDVDGTYGDCHVEVDPFVDNTGIPGDFGGESFDFWLDNEAPYVDDTSGVDHSAPRYYNDAHTFEIETDDYGVDRETAYLEIRSGTTSGAVVTPPGTGATDDKYAELNTAGITAETAQNDDDVLAATMRDALGNWTRVQVGMPFGIDITEPVVDYTITYAAADIDSGETVAVLTDPVIFTLTYVDTSAATAGPSGFNPNPVSYTVRRYNGDDGTPPIESGSVAVSFDIDAMATDGYFVADATVTDAAGNFWTMPQFQILADDTPPEIGALTVPTILTGGQPFTMNALLRDNVDLGEGWATIGYSDTLPVPTAPYWIIQTKEVLGTYGYSSLVKSDDFGIITIPQVIRSIAVTDPATHRPTTNRYLAHVAEYAVLDVAGLELDPAYLCPDALVPLDFAADAFTANCRLRRANIFNAYKIANPVPRNYTANNTAFGNYILNNNAGLGTLSTFKLVGVQDTLGTAPLECMGGPCPRPIARITGPFQTFLNPFTNGVRFYAIDQYGRAHQILTPVTVGVFDDTILMTRTWSYTLSNTTWGGLTNLYGADVGVFAMGVDANGDALVTQTYQIPLP